MDMKCKFLNYLDNVLFPSIVCNCVWMWMYETGKGKHFMISEKIMLDVVLGWVHSIIKSKI